MALERVGQGTPASTSLRTSIQMSRSLSFSVCSSITYSDRSSDMPDWTIVDSWRVAMTRSSGLIFWKRARMSPALAGDRSSMSTTISPRVRSCDATDCLSFASISPLLGAPARSSALNAYVAIRQATRTVPMSRRSSSGVLERASASSRVIFCSRTSWASAVSIVCIPNCAPVCSAE